MKNLTENGRYISVYFEHFLATICGFLVCIVTDLSCSNSFSKDGDLSPHKRCKHFSCRGLILLFTI